MTGPPVGWGSFGSDARTQPLYAEETISRLLRYPRLFEVLEPYLERDEALHRELLNLPPAERQAFIDDTPPTLAELLYPLFEIAAEDTRLASGERAPFLAVAAGYRSWRQVPEQTERGD